jgi:D-glycero-D-manno-heptose 1,7-bisphosphate phosphatase
MKYSREKPEEVLMVGDRPEDQQAASSANIPFMWAEDWRNGK